MQEKDGKPLAARLGERLDQATAQIEGEAIGDPLGVARMQQTLGKSQLGLGYPEKAITLFTKARATFTAQLGPDHPDTLTSMNDLAIGLPGRRQARAGGAAVRGDARAHEEVEARSRPPRHSHSMNNLASAYQAAGKLDRALPLYRGDAALRKSKLGPDHPDTLKSMNNLAAGYRRAKRLDRSILLFEECLKLRRVKSGEDHPDTMLVKANLGVNYRTRVGWRRPCRCSRKRIGRSAKTPSSAGFPSHSWMLTCRPAGAMRRPHSQRRCSTRPVRRYRRAVRNWPACWPKPDYYC